MTAEASHPPTPRVEFRCLGPVRLAGPNGRPLQAILSQPKRLALLTAVALSKRGGFVSRDHLLALFWPEHDVDRARNALNQALHRLRGGLGPEVLRTRGRHEVGLDPERFWCDALAFREAVRAEAWGLAMDLNQGALLDGLHVAMPLPLSGGWRGSERLCTTSSPWPDRERRRRRWGKETRAERSSSRTG